MLVRKVALFRLLLVGLLTVSTMFSAYADQTSCEATEVFYNGVAQKAESALASMQAKVEQYNTHVKSAIMTESSPCYTLRMQLSLNSATPYDWSGFDLNGAAQAGASSDEIKKIISKMDLSKINLNLSDFAYANDRRSASSKIRLKLSQSEAEKQKIENDLKIFQQCRIEIFNLQQEQNEILELRNNASVYLTTLSKPQETTCSCDESGTLKSCSTVSETPEEVSAKSMSCKNLNEEVGETAMCITCNIFERILMADQKLAKGAFSALSGGLIKILSLGFLLYLAYQTLILVSSPANQSMSKYLTSITIQGFKVLIAVFILSNPDFLYNLALKPILEGGIDFGITLSGDKQAAILEAGAKYTHFDTSDTLLSAPFLQKMVGTADAFSTKAAIMPAMGKAAVCNAFTNLDWNIIPNIEVLLEGVLVTIFGYIISLSVGFYLLDLTVELGFICCLLPFLIACWPFKLTSSYVKVGWNIFLHIFFNFVMLGVVITVINTLMGKALAPGDDISVLINAINNNDFETLKEIMDIGGMQILTLIVCCYISIKLLKDVQSLSNKFAGGAGLNISPLLGGLAMSAAASFGKAGGAVGLKGLARGLDGAKAISDAAGTTGAMKSVGQTTANALGFNKMKELASEAQKEGKDLFSRGVGKLGIGANAVERGGRQDGKNNGNNGAKKQ